MNVILIMADTWRFDYLGCYGNDWIKTPNLDRFAAESTVFENAYAEGCPTVPTRRALMTGRYTLPFRGWGPLLPEDETLTDILWQSSVASAMVSDTAPMHLPRYGYSRGFDYVRHVRGQEFDRHYRKDPCSIDMDRFHKPVYGPDGKTEAPASLWARDELKSFLPQRENWKDDEDQLVAQVVRSSLHFLEHVDRSRPFLFWLDSFDPHEPWDPPSVWNESIRCPYDPDYTEKDIILPVPTYVDEYLSDEECRHIRMLYAEKVTMVDRWLGKVLDKLRDTGLYDESLLIFISDHGQPFGRNEHGHGIIRKCRPWPYEELSHIPLIVRLPGAKPSRVSSFVETVDIAPTILDFFGEQWRMDDMQGQSLLPLIRGEKAKLREFAISGYYGFSWSIIGDEWSYIHWLDNKTFDDPHKQLAVYGMTELDADESIWTCTPGSVAETPRTNELYDRKKDPFQLNNLLEEKPGIAHEQYTRLLEHMIALKAT
jgi:arylsulfatase A-like enzyme